MKPYFLPSTTSSSESELSPEKFSNFTAISDSCSLISSPTGKVILTSISIH